MCYKNPMKHFGKRSFCGIRVLMFIGLFVAATAPSKAEPESTALPNERPNIVLIISDDHSFTDYGFMGHDTIQTPHLDKLASESAVFRRGYVPTALCRPALMTMATGLYAHQHLITGNDPTPNDINQKHVQAAGETAKELLISQIDSIETLPRLLAQNGYLSHQSGKWWEGSYQRGGFTHGMTRGYPKPQGRHGDDGLNIGRHGMQPVTDFMDLAIKQDKPFFMWYAPFLPHTPHNPPQRLLDKYIAEGRPLPVAKYYAMVDWFDETIGQLLGALDERGIAEQTLVLYVTDNGWIQKTTGTGYQARSKRSPYEGGTRTPIMFRWLGQIQPVERPELCTSMDLFPTILSAGGVPIPDSRDGLDLLPALRTGKCIHRDTIFGESFAHDIADIKDPEASLLYRWVIQGHMKLLLTYDGQPGQMVYPPTDFAPQLFDLAADPLETQNLAAERPEQVKAMTALLDGWWKPERATHSGHDKP